MRSPAAIAALAASAFFVLLASAGGWIPWAGGFDRAGHAALVSHRSPAVTSAAAAFTSTALSAFTVPLVFVVAVLITQGGVRARLVRATLVLALMLSAVLCRSGIAELIARPRPPSADWAVQASGSAFPSGHTSDATLAAGLIAWLVACRVTSRATRWTAWILAAAYALSIAWTRVYLGVHWPTDVLGSIAFASAWLCGGLVLQRLAKRHASVHQPR